MSTLQERMAYCFPPPQERGLRAAIARTCGVSAPTVTAWFDKPEKVATMDRAYAEKLCKTYRLDVSPAWLSTGDGPKLAADVGNTRPGPDAHGPYPLISDVQAGRWTVIYDNFQPGDADEWMCSTKNLSKNGYLLRVKGKSMYAPGEKYSFQEGMILHVNPNLVPRPGQFVVVRRELFKSAATFKRYILLDGSPYLEAINPNWPPEEKYIKLQPGDVWCGVVVDATVGNLP